MLSNAVVTCEIKPRNNFRIKNKLLLAFVVVAVVENFQPVELVRFLHRSPSKWLSDLILQWRIPPGRSVLCRSLCQLSLLMLDWLKVRGWKTMERYLTTIEQLDEDFDQTLFKRVLCNKSHVFNVCYQTSTLTYHAVCVSGDITSNSLSLHIYRTIILSCVYFLPISTNVRTITFTIIRCFLLRFFSWFFNKAFCWCWWWWMLENMK